MVFIIHAVTVLFYMYLKNSGYTKVVDTRVSCNVFITTGSPKRVGITTKFTRKKKESKKHCHFALAWYWFCKVITPVKFSQDNPWIILRQVKTAAG